MFQTPSSAEEWTSIAREFHTKWNFPNCLGALDGKHVLLRNRKEYGSYYHNYKGTNSIILLALVSANLEFIYADVGVNGRASDAAAWDVSQLRASLEDNSLQVPGLATLPNSDKALPHVIVADDAFPLKRNLMKPYSFKSEHPEQRIFSYRLSRARRTSENAFGILANRFRVLLAPMNLRPKKVKTIVLATLVLHNLLRKLAPASVNNNLDTEDIERGIVIEGRWRSQGTMLALQESDARNAAEEAKHVREQFMEYFCNEGAVPWQNRYLYEH